MSSRDETQIIISPNASLGRGAAVGALAVISLTTLAVGLAWTLAGFWLVLPFAGLEVAVLVAVFRYLLRQGQFREVIRIGAERITVQTGRGRPERECHLPRPWTRVVCEPGRFRGYPCRLWLRAGGRQVEVGSCLTDREREALWQRLKALLPSAEAAGADNDNDEHTNWRQRGP